jgi:hypothetical protein
MKHILTTLCCAAALASPFALAGSGHDHGPRHGGIVRDAGKLTLELVAKADSLTLHVTDHDKPVATAGAKAQVTLYGGSEKTVVPLEPAGDNRMAAKGSFKVGVGVRAALVFELPGKPAVKANFNLK